MAAAVFRAPKSNVETGKTLEKLRMSVTYFRQVRLIQRRGFHKHLLNKMLVDLHIFVLALL